MKANLLVDAVLGRGLADIFQDARPIGDRLRFGPRLEGIAKREHVAVGADAGIAKKVPRAADAVAPFENDKALARAFVLQMIAGANAGKPGADDQHIEMFGWCGRLHELSSPITVMAGHSRSKNGVASARLCPAIHAFGHNDSKDVDARHKAGHDEIFSLSFRGTDK